MVTDLLFFFIIALASIVSGIVGFGSSILALPFLSLFLDVKTIVPVMILIVVFNGVPRLIHQYHSINWRVYFISLPFAIAGGMVGIQLSATLHEGGMKLLLAILMLLIAVKGMVELNGLWQIRPREKHNPLLLFFPFMAGVMQAGFASGGPFFSLYIVMILSQKEQIRATQFAVGTTTAVFVILRYFQAGVYQGEVMHFVYLLVPAVILAYFVSEKIFNKIDGKQFLKLVYIVLIVAGCMTGWQALHLF